MQKNMTPGRRKDRPNYSPEFKQQLVAASCEPGISISKLALENGINANLIFKWRQQWLTESCCYLPLGVLNGVYSPQTPYTFVNLAAHL
jgi:transposase-like protein